MKSIASLHLTLEEAKQLTADIAGPIYEYKKHIITERLGASVKQAAKLVMDNNPAILGANLEAQEVVNDIEGAIDIATIMGRDSIAVDAFTIQKYAAMMSEISSTPFAEELTFPLYTRLRDDARIHDTTKPRAE